MTDTQWNINIAFLGAAGVMWAVHTPAGAASAVPAILGGLVVAGVLALHDAWGMGGRIHHAAHPGDDIATETAWYEPHDCLRAL